MDVGMARHGMAWHGVAYIIYVWRPPALCEVGRSLLEEGLELIDGGAAQLDERWSEQRDLFALRVSAPLVEGLRVVRPQVQVAKSAPRRNRLGVLQQHAAKASAASRRVNHDRCDGRGEAVRILARRLKPTVCYDRVIRIQQEQVARDLVLFCLAHMRQQGGAAASGARGGPLRGEQRSGGADEIRPVAEQDARRRRRNCRRRHSRISCWPALHTTSASSNKSQQPDFTMEEPAPPLVAKGLLHAPRLPLPVPVLHLVVSPALHRLDPRSGFLGQRVNPLCSFLAQESHARRQHGGGAIAARGLLQNSALEWDAESCE